MKESKENIQTPQENLSPEQQEILAQLKQAHSAEERVKTFAKMADHYGLEAIFGLLLPWAGDLATSILSGLYLIFEGGKANLSWKDFVKIACLQGADFAIGVIPVVGNLFDFFFTANKLSATYFTEKTQELIKKARNTKPPIQEEKIAKIQMEAEKLPRLLEHAVEIYKNSPLAKVMSGTKEKLKQAWETNPQV